MRFKKHVQSINGIVVLRCYSERPVDYHTFINAIKKEIEDVNTHVNNVSLSYIDDQGKTTWLNLPSKAIIGIEKVFDNFDEEEIYHGSDRAEDVLRYYTLNTKVFKIMYQPIVGGASSIELDYYICVNLTSDDNNCLLECFKYYTNCTESNDVLRNNISLPDNSMLSINHVKMLEDYFGIDVVIYEDKVDIDFEYVNNKDPNKCLAIIRSYSPVILYGNKNTNHKIVYNNNHYSIYKSSIHPRLLHCLNTGKFVGKDNTLTNEEIIEELHKQNRLHDDSSIKSMKMQSFYRDENTYFYFFDYETVYHPITFELIPYCFAMIKCDDQGNVLKEWISFDCNNIKDIILMEKPTEYEVKYLVGYNNSRFDNFILLKLFGYDDLKDIRFAGNSIISGEIKGFKLRDLCRFLNMPLRNACQSFKCNFQKESLEHHDVQNAYTAGNWDIYINENKDTISSYVLMDCKALAELWFKTENAFYNIIGEKIRDHRTIAGMSYNIFKQTFDDILPIAQEPHQSMIRKAIYGGRSQIFQKGEFKIPLCSIDCVSLYPYVMLENVYPVGDIWEINKQSSGNIGVYNTKLLSQPDVKIIPKREDTLNWNNNMVYECHMSSIDIQCLQSHNSELEINEGIVWASSRKNVFKEYFDPIVKEKIRQDKLKQENNTEYNHTLRETCKLLMNALSGKLIQRNHDRIIEIIKNNNDLNKLKNKMVHDSVKFYELDGYIIASGKKINSKNNMPTIWGVLIYSYARSHMYNTVLAKINKSEIFGMDTDSAFITVEQYHKLLDGCPKIFGDKFGQFKIETYDHYGIFVAPKCYCFYKLVDGKEELVKWRFKGINVNKDKILDTSIVKNIKNMTGKELHNLYFSDKLSKTTINTFRKLLKNKVYYLCSNLTKKIINKDNALEIKQRFYIKEINIINNVLNEEVMLVY